MNSFVRTTFLTLSWAWWVALPFGIGNVFVDGPDIIDTLSVVLIYLGGAIWVVVFFHSLKFKLSQKTCPFGWPHLVIFLGPLAAPFYILKEVPKHKTKTKDALAS